MSLEKSQAKKLIQEEVKNFFGNKIVGDNPTDALQLVNKRYAITGGPGSIIGYSSLLTADPAKGRLFTITTTSSVATVTINASSIGLYGQQMQFLIKNDNNGSRTVVFAGNFKASSVVGIASLAATVSFVSDGSTAFYETSRTLGL